MDNSRGLAEELIPLKPRPHAKNLDEKTEFWTEPRYCMVLGLKPMGKPITHQNQVLDRTKVLYGPRTQTYGETNYLDEKTEFWAELRYCMALGLKPMERSAT